MWSLGQGSPKDLAKAHENEGGRKKNEMGQGCPRNEMG